MSRLDEQDITRRLAQIPGWSRNGDVIAKTFSFERFMDGIDFVNRVARLADAADHHPDVDIRFTKVTLSLSTHSDGGLTARDFDLALQIGSLVPAGAPPSEETSR